MLKSLIKVAVLLLFTVNVYGQSDFFNFSGNGARAAGMGYAFTGIADDATAISWNSAGLTQIYSAEASVIGRVGLNSVELTNYRNWGWEHYDIDKASNFKLNFASIVIPFEIGNRNVVVGVAFRNQYDFNSDTKQSFGDGISEYRIENVLKGGINTISPSFSVEINEMLSVGTAVNILTGSLKADILNNYRDIAYDYAVDLSGVSFDIGVFIKPSNIITLGANLNLPHTVTWKGDWPFNDLNGNFLYVDKVELETHVPFFYSVGLGLHATDNFLIGFDFQSRAWSNGEDVQIKPKIADNTRSFSDNDLNSIHVGAEYLLQGGNAVIPIRAGFYTNPRLQNDSNGDQISTSVFSVGMGLVMEAIIIDAAFEFSGLDQDQGDNVVWEETNNRLTIGATIHFGD